MAGEAESLSAIKQPLFRDITADEEEPEVTEIESLCISCEEQGMTRLFLTKIPFFREVVIASFHCDHCGYRNAELQPAGRIQDKGCTYTVNIRSAQDLNRQIVLNQTASICIPVLEFESPPNRGVLTTVEGIITQTISDLERDQVLRRIQDPENAAKIDEFLEKMRKLLLVEKAFDIVVDDPAGNSFMENPRAPSRDPQMTISHYERTQQQNISLGLTIEDGEEPGGAGAGGGGEGKVGTTSEGFDSTNEVLHFAANCPGCNTPCETNMKLVNIPHFKEVVIMATNCEACGHRDNEVKSGGGMEAKGRKITVSIEKVEDLSRDVLKSETCSVLIPELDFEADMGTLGGKFTTVEGLLSDFKEQLQGDNSFLSGDSASDSMSYKLREFCQGLDKIISGEKTNIHLILDDPAGNSYIQNLAFPELDSQLTVEDYKRSFQQNEDLGINDMKTENYENI